MSGRLWLRCKRVECNKCCMSCHCKNMGQLLVHCKDVWLIGTLSIETSPDPYWISTIFFFGIFQIELILSKQRYLVGGQLTEADIRLFTTLIRFDPVYVNHFKVIHIYHFHNYVVHSGMTVNLRSLGYHPLYYFKKASILHYLRIWPLRVHQ